MSGDYTPVSVSALTDAYRDDNGRWYFFNIVSGCVSAETWPTSDDCVGAYRRGGVKFVRESEAVR